MLESVIESRLRQEAKKRGGMALKFVSPGMNGVPDRIVLMPGGKMAFVELKAPGESAEGAAGKKDQAASAAGIFGLCAGRHRKGLEGF